MQNSPFQNNAHYIIGRIDALIYTLHAACLSGANLITYTTTA